MPRYISYPILVLLTVLLTPHILWATPDKTVQEILSKAGVRGGLIVHVGCGTGALTAAFGQKADFMVHGLSTDRQEVRNARKALKDKGIYGNVSVDWYDGTRLPYAENMVNLVVVETPGKLSDKELLRVLVPEGVALTKAERGWNILRKPLPASIDEWTHYLHDAGNNAVADDDIVGPPRHLQWMGSPKWARHHDKLSSLHAVVTSKGRLFYILDEGSRTSIILPPKWKLVARDAYNGVVLWKRDIEEWHTHLWPLKSGPAQLPRRLVAVGDTVYVTLGINQPVTALDAASGTTRRTYPNTKGAEEILVDNGTLYTVVDRNPNLEKYRNPALMKKPWWTNKKRAVMAFNAATGKVLWEHDKHPVLPLTLGVSGNHVAFHDGSSIVCLNPHSGAPLWTSEPVARPKQLMSFFGPTLVMKNGVLLFAGGEVSGLVEKTGGMTKDDTITAFDLKDGKKLWSAPHPPSGYSSPEDVFVIDNKVWYPRVSNGRLDGQLVGRDLRTGKALVDFKADVATYWFHHRCYRGKATKNFLLTSRTGIEFIDLATRKWNINHWVRGSCLYGVMPANGLVYSPPHACACYPESKLFGLNALAPARPLPKPDTTNRLYKGPAFGKIASSEAKVAWPTYRGNNARSGFTPHSVPAAVKKTWSTAIGGRLSAITVALGKVFVSAIDRHTIHALDAATGEPVWQFTAGARIDSPPTISKGMVFFGCADGYVYSLRASDGELAWQFRAAPSDRRVMVFEQLESVWPVHGSVLLRDDVVYFTAGRSMFLDGGIHFYKLNAKTGAVIASQRMTHINPKTGKGLHHDVKWLNMPVALSDILACDDSRLYMRSQVMDMNGTRSDLAPISHKAELIAANQGPEGRHLFSPAGFLDGTYFHRSYWVYGKRFSGGWNGYPMAGKRTPGGKIMVHDDNRVYSFGRDAHYFRWTIPMEHALFAAPTSDKAHKKIVPTPRKPGYGASYKNMVSRAWSTRLPILVRAMAKAGDHLVLAGPPDLIDEQKIHRQALSPTHQKQLAAQDRAMEGEAGGSLLIHATDGKRLSSLNIEHPPVWDGISTAYGTIFMATTDGSVNAFGRK